MIFLDYYLNFIFKFINFFPKEFLFNEKQILLTRELTGSSITKKSDETIQTAVLALNEELINRIQHDYI